MRWLEADWNNFSSKMEQLILAKHAKNGKFITMIFVVILFASVVFFVVLLCLPRLLQIAMPGNNIPTYKLPFLLEYFVDPDKYFCFIVLHFLFINLIGVCVLIATEAVYVISVEHGCGLFELASYHIQTIMDDTTLHFMEHSLICEKVKTCAHAILYTGALNEILVSGVFIIADLGYVFSCSYIGQMVLNQYTSYFFRYDTEWYSAPLPIQKVLLLFLQRSMKTCTLSCGGIFISSYRLQLAVTYPLISEITTHETRFNAKLLSRYRFVKRRYRTL
ncbi:uncharacterized protein LOC143345657 [Colletes latitarsis]|uniref:uncharacterized protein LOC143345657 n=1 Tax=Colletes latitarsis TaxID=2605962 RepID=UPI0040352346